MNQSHPDPIVTAFTERLGIKYPLLQDGMGGGALGTGRLAAAVSNAGALGSLSTPGSSVGPELEQIMRDQIEVALSLTEEPLAMNIPVGTDKTGKVLQYTQDIFDIVVKARQADSAAERQLVMVTTSAGHPGLFSHYIHDAGMLHQHKVGAPRHAERAVEAGADFVIASGYEMGGHTHQVPITTMVLAPEVLDRVDVPVLVSGGIKDGRGLAAMLAAGAAGVAMGTRFLVSAESDWHDRYIERVMEATVAESVVMPGLYGPCRYLQSKACDELLDLVKQGTMTEDELTEWKEHRSHIAQRDGDIEHGFTAAGMIGGFITDRPPVAEIVDRIVTQAHELLGRFARMAPV